MFNDIFLEDSYFTNSNMLPCDDEPPSLVTGSGGSDAPAPNSDTSQMSGGKIAQDPIQKGGGKSTGLAAGVLSGIGKALSSGGGRKPEIQYHPAPAVEVPAAQSVAPVSVPATPLKSFKKGGMVHKTAVYKLHKGELVVPKHKVDAMTHDILSGKEKPSNKTRVIHIKKSHEGKLHAKLGKKPGAKLSLASEEKAKHSGSPAERKEATFAINARSWNHKK